MNQAVTVQCSTAIAPILAGGRYDDFAALLVGIEKLNWPRLELRLWDNWLGPHLLHAADRLSGGGVQIGTIHAPPVEQFIGLTGECGRALVLLEASSQTMPYLGASSMVVHAWDLRVPGFDPVIMVETLHQFHESHPSVSLAVELIPGYTKMLPLLVKHCCFANFVVDTQWASLENNWRLLFDNASRVTNLHVQSFLDADEQGGIRLGRGRFGADCDVPDVVKRLCSEGYAGWLTLEPVGVPLDGATLIRRALVQLNTLIEDRY